MIFRIVFLFTIATCAMAQVRQTVSVDQYGRIEPAGYIAGLSDIARAEAVTAAATQAVAITQATMLGASNVLRDVVTMLTGTYGFIYVTGHVTSFSGAIVVDTNVMAYIDYFQPGLAGAMTTNGVEYTGHYLWHHYTSVMNTTPYIKYKRTIDATNEWTFVELQSTDYFDNVDVNGIHYDTIYRSTVWIPTAYNNAFFQAFCEIIPGGQAGAPLDIVGEVTIGGERMLTQIFTNSTGRIETYVSGLLKEVSYVE